MAPSLKIGIISMHTSPAHLPGSADAGGMNVVERAQAIELAKLGHDVVMVTRRSDPDDPDVVELAPGVTLRHVDAGPRAPLPKSRIDDHLDQFADGLQRLGAFDVFHSHHWMSGVAALPIARQLGAPHVQSFHSVAAHAGSPLADGEPPESPRRVAGEALVAQQSQAVVAISAAEARTAIQRCGADPNRVHVIAPGVDHELFRPLAPGEQPSLVRPTGYVVFAARLQPLKAPDLAVAAVAQLPPAERPHLVLAGEASADFADYTAELKQLVSELGLANDVSFVGSQPREALAQLFRGAKAVLVPSHSETFGLVALEAAASGVPVVAASSGGLREAVAQGETGLLLASRDPVVWGNALRELLADPQRREVMGVVARVHARRFDWGWTARRLEALYQALLAGVSSSGGEVIV